MYRLMLYFLIVLLGVSIFFSFIGVLSYNPLSIIFSTLILIATCIAVNNIFSFIFKAPTNVESVYITALILALIITPINSPPEILFLVFAGFLAMVSKYIFAVNHKHIFNPAAFAVAITSLTINQAASWWVGTLPMVPFVLIGGLLIVRKIQREYMVFTFLTIAILSIILFGISNGGNAISAIQSTILDTPLLYFAFVMLTEPSTTPPTKKLQIAYGGLIGLFFAPQIRLGTIYLTPELALLIGNVFSFIVSPKIKLKFTLKNRVKLGPDIYEFLLETNQKVSFKPGQYMEWTLPHKHPDSRGNRRYFTLASSPTEKNIKLGVKFNPKPSSFKKSIVSIPLRSPIVASQLSGDFVLPENQSKKLVFIAGGIGITPFRSMVRYLLDKGETRDIVLFYSNKTSSEIVYKNIFHEAEKKVGLKTIYVLTDKTQVQNSWKGKVGHINEDMIIKEVPEYKSRVFYLSGPHSMVVSFQEVLRKLKVPKKQIKIDFFPGFA